MVAQDRESQLKQSKERTGMNEESIMGCQSLNRVIRTPMQYGSLMWGVRQRGGPMKDEGVDVGVGN